MLTCPQSNQNPSSDLLQNTYENVGKGLPVYRDSFQHSFYQSESATWGQPSGIPRCYPI
uniref:Uncharacterized protein n=1 Tax=Picea glauca TaxID=3330 RepID=A0A101LXD2_PICGL|nr:hypothetical protein ABT39_MTgene6358 [Picea glauca]